MKRYDIFYADEIRETIDGEYVLAEEALALEARVKELERQLASYEAQVGRLRDTVQELLVHRGMYSEKSYRSEDNAIKALSDTQAIYDQFKCRIKAEAFREAAEDFEGGWFYLTDEPAHKIELTFAEQLRRWADDMDKGEGK